MGRSSERDYSGCIGQNDGGLVVILSGWPRVSETFAANELRALAQRGLLTAVFATKPADTSLVQPTARELDSLVQILDEHPDPAVQANQIADRLRTSATGKPVRAVHGYFAHHPTDVAMRVADILGAEFGFSVHALDARKISTEALADRSARARLVVSCNEDAAAVVEGAGGSPILLRHGVSLHDFPFEPAKARRDDRTRLLAVGRLVEKKGFVHLIEAMAELQPETTLRIVGDGPERERLQSTIDRLGLAERVEFAGRLTHDELPAEYQAADIVVVPSVIASNGDRDGLPNVVLEAMASGRPVVAARTAAIPAAIRHNENGILVEPNDSSGLAQAIARLAAEPEEQLRLGKEARAEVERRFSLDGCSSQFADLLIDRYGLGRPQKERTQ